MATNDPVSQSENQTTENHAAANQTGAGPLARSPIAAYLKRGAPALLSVLLVVQIALIAFVYWPSEAAHPTGSSLLTEFNAEAILQLHIEDATSQSVTLLREDNGWVVADSDGFPANDTKADETLTKLANMNTNRLVTRTESSHARLQVAANNFNRRITLTDSTGEEAIVYLGASAGGAATHVRVQGDSSVYLTGQLAAWEVEPFLSGWVNTSYLSVPTADIQTVALHNPQGTVTLARDENQAWTADWLEDDETLDPNEVNILLSRVGSLSLSNVLGQSPPQDTDPDSPLVQVELEIRQADTGESQDNSDQNANDAEPELITFYIDRLPDALAQDAEPELITPIEDVESGTPGAANTEAYFAKSSTSNYYVQVSAFNVEPLISLTADELLQTGPPSDAQFPQQPVDPESGLQLPQLDELPLEESMLDETSLDEAMLEELLSDELESAPEQSPETDVEELNEGNLHENGSENDTSATDQAEEAELSEDEAATE